MKIKIFVTIILILIIEANPVETGQVSYNQPKFNACVSWNPNRTTLARFDSYRNRYSGLFISTNNTIYSIEYRSGIISVWPNMNNTSVFNISTNITEPNSLFVTDTGSIYVPDGKNGRIYQLVNSTVQPDYLQMSFSHCYGVFVDRDDSIYCSFEYGHDIRKKAKSMLNNQSSRIAGKNCSGDTPDRLTYPHGIFVDTNFTLYVADSGNHRIQRFYRNEANGTTVAGLRATESFRLHFPTSVILDADGYLFIVDSKNHRIVRSGPGGFHCILGCSEVSGWLNYQFSEPSTISFDVEGNIFVTDLYNYRIQRFSLINDSCLSSRTSTIPNSVTPVSNTSNVTNSILAISYNQPTFSANATWNCSGMTWMNQSDGIGMFVDRNNTVYYGGSFRKPIFIWEHGIQTQMKNFSLMETTVHSLFVTPAGHIIADQGYDYTVKQIDLNGTTETIIQMQGACYGLFVDIYNNIYCSLYWLGQVVMKPFNTDIANLSVVAGIACYDNSSVGLNRPYGIFVDENLTLYVADSGNNRIQLFRHGNSNGTTLVGRWGTINYTLSEPTSVILDGSGYLFIVEKGQDRIIRQTAGGFRCIIGCLGTPSPLTDPITLALDSLGNIFVTDRSGSRLQKFTLSTNSCDSLMTTSEFTPTNVWQNFRIEYIDINETCSDMSTTLETPQVTTENPTTPKQSTSMATSTPNQCNNASSQMGTLCNISASACSILNPCLNDGTCVDNRSLSQGYKCSCKSDFNGLQCQLDLRKCQPNTCRNGGICSKNISSNSLCICVTGWTGEFCETMIDYCRNATCQNNAVCRPLLNDYRCECLTSSYSGRHCEIVSQSLTIKKAFCRSMTFVCLILLGITVSFFVIMDLLQYVFHIDPVRTERRQLRQAKSKKKRSTAPPRHSQPIHYKYIHENRATL